jgi:hypothetical protein
VNPICATTALGPQGRSTTWYQPPVQRPTDEVIDPRLRGQPIPTPDHDKVPITVGDTPAINTPPSDLAPKIPQPTQVSTPAKNRPPKSSTFSHDALQKARASISSIPKKRTVVDTLIDLQWCVVLMVYFSESHMFFAVKTYMLNDRSPTRNSFLTNRGFFSRNSSLGYGRQELIAVGS